MDETRVATPALSLVRSVIATHFDRTSDTQINHRSFLLHFAGWLDTQDRSTNAYVLIATGKGRRSQHHQGDACNQLTATPINTQRHRNVDP